MQNDVNLIPSFGKTLFDSVVDSGVDTLDWGLDSLADSVLNGNFDEYLPIIQDLPIIKYFISAGKIVANVRDRLFLKKSLIFFEGLKDGKIDTEAIERRREALLKQEKWVYDELEILVLSIEQLNRTEKAKIISEIYRTYLNGEIDRKTFDDFCAITEQIFLRDLVQLRTSYMEEFDNKEFEENKNGIWVHTEYVEYVGRLLALGLMRSSVDVGQSIPRNCNLLEYSITRRGRQYAYILNKIDFLGIK